LRKKSSKMKVLIVLAICVAVVFAREYINVFWCICIHMYTIYLYSERYYVFLHIIIGYWSFTWTVPKNFWLMLSLLHWPKVCTCGGYLSNKILNSRGRGRVAHFYASRTLFKLWFWKKNVTLERKIVLQKTL